MNRRPDDNEQFQQLAQELAQAEEPLRQHFARTPPLDVAALERLKVRMQAEVAAIHQHRPVGTAWKRHLAATAATLLLALGMNLWVRSGSVSPAGGTARVQAPPTAALETFAANLSAVLLEEDSEVRELYDRMDELEMQVAGGTVDFEDFAEPAAERPWSEDRRQIAAG